MKIIYISLLLMFSSLGICFLRGAPEVVIEEIGEGIKGDASLLVGGEITKPANPILDKDILEASKNGDPKAVEKLLKNGANANALDKAGNSVLMLTRRGDIVAILKKYGAKTSMQLKYLEEGKKFLKDDKNDVEFRRDFGFFYAVALGDTDTINQFIKAGVNLDNRKYHDDGVSPLMKAAEYGNLEVVKLLIEKGADMHQHTSSGRSLMYYAALGGNMSIVKFIISKNADCVRYITRSRHTILHAAVEGGNIDIVKLLIKKGADVNAKNKWNTTILHTASMVGHVDIIKLLIENGADVNAIEISQSSVSGHTALTYASGLGHFEAAKLLIEKGANIHVVNEHDRSAIHYAVLIQNFRLVNLLVEKGADLKAVYHVSQWDFLINIDLAKLLIKNGININATDTKGKSALDYAKTAEIKALLIKHGAKPGAEFVNTRLNSEIIEAATKGNLQKVKQLIENLADVNALNKNGYTALMFASLNGHTDIVKLLIEKGANIDAGINLENETALMFSSKNGHIDVVKTLLEKGADVKIRDSASRTAVDYAKTPEMRELFGESNKAGQKK